VQVGPFPVRRVICVAGDGPASLNEHQEPAPVAVSAAGESRDSFNNAGRECVANGTESFYGERYSAF